MLRQALALFRKIGDRAGEAKVLWGLAIQYMGRRLWDPADEILPRVVDAFRELDNRFGLGWALHNLGVLRVRQGRADEARAPFVEALELFRAAGDVSGVVLLLLDFAEQAAAKEEGERALRLFGAANALASRTGTQLGDTMREENAVYAISMLALMERTDPATKERLVREGATLSRDEAIALALAG
jgi:tetratricopeptide (TPR) repeat protein